MDGYAYESAAGDIIKVPPHDPSNAADTTDLASVPSFLWGLLASYGRQLRAALLHDHLCNEANQLKASNPKEAYARRRRADDLFRLSMRDTGGTAPNDRDERVGWGRSWLFWTGVSVGRYWNFRRGPAILLILQVICATYCVYGYCRLLPLGWISELLWRLPFLPDRDAPLSFTDPSQYLVYFIALIALSVVWGRDFRVTLISCIVAPIVLPVIVVTLGAEVVLNLPDIVFGVLPSEPGGGIGPTFRRFM